jgi:hypothetical protein
MAVAWFVSDSNCVDYPMNEASFLSSTATVLLTTFPFSISRGCSRPGGTSDSHPHGVVASQGAQRALATSPASGLRPPVACLIFDCMILPFSSDPNFISNCGWKALLKYERRSYNYTTTNPRGSSWRTPETGSVSGSRKGYPNGATE